MHLISGSRAYSGTFLVPYVIVHTKGTWAEVMSI